MQFCCEQSLPHILTASNRFCVQSNVHKVLGISFRQTDVPPVWPWMYIIFTAIKYVDLQSDWLCNYIAAECRCMLVSLDNFLCSLKICAI